MKILQQIAFVLCIGIVASCSAQKQPSVLKWDTSFINQKKENSKAQELLQVVTDKYDPYIKELNVGVSVLVMKDVLNERKKMTATMGDFDFDENTVFNIGSATKKITAILILQEEEMGHLKLTDSIGTYLAPINNVDGKLTIESLLRHRSGIGEIIGRDFEQVFFSKSDSLLDANILNNIPSSNPDNVGKHKYTNTNYSLLGLILERINDKSYFDLVEERIIKPCNMTKTYPYVSKKIPNLAHPIHNGNDVYEYLDYRLSTNYAYSAGSVASTLGDMSKFYDNLFNKNTLLNHNSVQKMIDFDDADYGLGMMKTTYNNVEYYGHGGNNIGYGYKEYYNPKTNELVLLFANTVQIPFGKLLRNDLLDFSDDKQNPIVFNNNSASDFKVNTGTYFFKEMDMNLVLIESNHLLFLMIQETKLPLVSYNKNTLETGLYGIELEINPDNIDEIIFRQNGMIATLTRTK